MALVGCPGGAQDRQTLPGVWLMAGKISKKWRFAINMPFTKRTGINGRWGSVFSLGVSDLLRLLAANIAAGVNDLGKRSRGPRERPARLGENR
jgi:hypothetical protein